MSTIIFRLTFKNRYILIQAYTTCNIIHCAIVTMKKEDRLKWEKEQKILRIVHIAQDIFFSKGYDAATIEEIARLVGYNKRTLYHYFRDKEELFLAVALHGLKVFNKILHHAFNNPAQNHNSLYSIGKAFYNFFLDYPEYFNLIMTYEARSCNYYPVDNGNAVSHYKVECQKIADDNTELVLKAIEMGIRDGSINTTLTPKQLMIILWGEVFGITQIIMIRKKYFKEAFGIEHTELFEHFLQHTEKSLKNQF